MLLALCSRARPNGGVDPNGVRVNLFDLGSRGHKKCDSVTLCKTMKDEKECNAFLTYIDFGRQIGKIDLSQSYITEGSVSLYKKVLLRAIYMDLTI